MLKTRVITAVILALGLLAVLFLLPAPASVACLTLIVALAAWEWAGLLHLGGPQRWFYALLTALLCTAVYAAGMPTALLYGLWTLALLYWLLLVPLWFRRKWRLRANAAGYLVGWLLLLPSWAAMVQLQGRSPWYLLAAMSLVWVADIAAYFAGRAWGKHKLAPGISPGKTWEGAFGACLGVTLYGALLARSGWSMSGAAAYLGLAVALLLVTGVSIVGDLFESLVKRQAGVKDSSRLLPGHGGILDRIDSLTSTLPLLAMAAQYFLGHD